MAGINALTGFILLLILTIAIVVAISRWVFRINDIVYRLDVIIETLEVGLDVEKSEPRPKFWQKKE